METKRKLIDLTGLSQFLKDLKDWVKAYFDSRIDSEMSTTSTNPVQNKVVQDRLAKRIWYGSSEDIEAAVVSGEIEPGYTTIVTWDDAEEPNMRECTYDEILALFPEYA